MEDNIVKATVFDGMVRAYVATTTKMVEEARKMQGTWATASAALGRSLTITSLMGAMLKGEDTITTKIEGDGPLGAIICDSNPKGETRGYVLNPQVDFPLNEQGKLDVRSAVGTEGTVSIVEDLGLHDLFTGQVPIVSGEISEQFTYYFANSEQIPSAGGAGVLVNPDHTISAAGGFSIQLMPGAGENIITEIEEALAKLPHISTLVQEGKNSEQILKKLFNEQNVNILGQHDILFKCKCSKERMLNAIKGLGEIEIKEMIEQDHGAETTCHFCNHVYQISESELHKLLS